jgi:ribosomal protein S18 acetylase RimI-like enzyme
MDHVKSDGQREDCSVLEVSVNEGNERAAAFYELCGFVPVRRVLRFPLKTNL